MSDFHSGLALYVLFSVLDGAFIEDSTQVVKNDAKILILFVVYVWLTTSLRVVWCALYDVYSSIPLGVGGCIDMASICGLELAGCGPTCSNPMASGFHN